MRLIESIGNILEILKFKDHKPIYIDEYIKLIRTTLNEELGISKEVISISQSILKDIKLTLRKRNPMIDSNSVQVWRNKWSINIYGVTFTIYSKQYMFENFAKFQRLKSQDDLRSSFSFEKKQLIFVGYGYQNMWQESELYDTIYHEVEHLYQTIKSGKSLNSNDSELYKLAIDAMSVNDNEALSVLGYVIYLSRRYEQTAYSHGLYGMLKSEQPQSRDEINGIIPYSQLYSAYAKLKMCKEYISFNKENPQLMQGLKHFNKNYNWFLKLVDRAIQQTVRCTSRTISKYINDLENGTK